MLLEQLTKQEPGQDRDEGIWNISMAAGTCLGLVAQCVKDEIVSLVMPYVQVGLAARGAFCTPDDQPLSLLGIEILCMHFLLCYDQKYAFLASSSTRIETEPTMHALCCPTLVISQHHVSQVHTHVRHTGRS